MESETVTDKSLDMTILMTDPLAVTDDTPEILADVIAEAKAVAMPSEL